MTATKSPRFRARPLASAMAATAAGASFAAVTTVQAQIVYSGLQNIVVPFTKGASPVVSLDLALDGSPDIVFGLVPNPDFPGFAPATSADAPISMTSASFGDKGDWATTYLPVGAAFDPAHQGTLIQVTDDKSIGFLYMTPPGPGDHYTGFLFSKGGSDYYGWLRVSSVTDVLFPNTYTFVDWAYNSVPNGGILVGQTVAVPEPESWGFLFAAGLIGWRLWSGKRRRASQREQS